MFKPVLFLMLTGTLLPRKWQNFFGTKKKDILVHVFLGGCDKIMIIVNI